MTAWPPDEIERFMAGTELFGDLPPEERKELAGKATVKTVPAGELVFRRGDEGNSIFVLAAGKVWVNLEGPDGEETVSSLQAGDFFGEIALLTRSRRTATITASEDLTALEFQAADVLPLCERHPAVKTILGRAGARRSQESMKKLLGE